MVPQENGILKKSFVGVDEILSNRTKIVGTVKFNADDSQKLHTTILRLVNEQCTEENTVRDKPEMKILGPNLQNKHVLINFQLRRQSIKPGKYWFCFTMLEGCTTNANHSGANTSILNQSRFRGSGEGVTEVSHVCSCPRIFIVSSHWVVMVQFVTVIPFVSHLSIQVPFSLKTQFISRLFPFCRFPCELFVSTKAAVL